MTITTLFFLFCTCFLYEITAQTQSIYIGLKNSTRPQSLKPHDSLASGDQFGQAVAIWDDVCLVSATKRAVLSSNSPTVHADIEGVVFVFTQNDKRQWSDTGTVLASSVAEDGFGHSVSVYQGTAAVGAPYDDVHGTDSGLAYVYYSTSSSNGQNLLGNYYTLQSEQQRAYDYFGYSVAVVPGDSYYSHGTVLVGAYGHDWDGRMMNSGAIFVFANSGTAWFQVVMLQPSQPYMNGHFGWSLAGYKNAVAVGAPGQESVYLFHLEPVQTECPHDRPPDQMPSGCQEHMRKLQGGDPAHHTYLSWNYVEILHVQNNMETNKGDLFGSSVAVINETVLTLVVGSPYDGSGGTASGSVVILTQLPKSDIWNSWSPGNPNNAEHHSGANILQLRSGESFRQLQPQDMIDHRMNIWNIRSNTYATDKDGSYWMLAKKMTGSSMDRFGQSVAVSENHVLVGTHTGNSKKGKATIFVFNSTKWQQTDLPIYRGPLYMKEWKKETDLYDAYGGVGDYFGYTLGIYEETAIVGAFLTGYQSKWNIGTGGAYIYDAIQLVTVDNEETEVSSSPSAESNSLTIHNPFLRMILYSSIVMVVLVVFVALLQTVSSNLGLKLPKPLSSLSSLSFNSETDLDDSGKSFGTAEMTSSHPLTAYEENRLLPSHQRFHSNTAANLNHGTSSHSSPRPYEKQGYEKQSSSSPYPSYPDPPAARRGTSRHQYQQPPLQPEYGGQQAAKRPAYATPPPSSYTPAVPLSHARTTSSYHPPSASSRYSNPPQQQPTSGSRSERPPRTFQY